jgi:predicted nucleic acid-binding Zn ribbon protein
VRRAGPRPVAVALDALTARLQPPTLLADVQRVWPRAAGPFADIATPFAERDGTVTVACPQAVWAQELDLMAERVTERLNEELGRHVVGRLRVQARPAPRPDPPGD